MGRPRRRSFKHKNNSSKYAKVYIMLLFRVSVFFFWISLKPAGLRTKEKGDNDERWEVKLWIPFSCERHRVRNFFARARTEWFWLVQASVQPSALNYPAYYGVSSSLSLAGAFNIVTTDRKEHEARERDLAKSLVDRPRWFLVDSTTSR